MPKLVVHSSNRPVSQDFRIHSFSSKLRIVFLLSVLAFCGCKDSEKASESVSSPSPAGEVKKPDKSRLTQQDNNKSAEDPVVEEPAAAPPAMEVVQEEESDFAEVVEKFGEAVKRLQTVVKESGLDESGEIKVEEAESNSPEELKPEDSRVAKLLDFLESKHDGSGILESQKYESHSELRDSFPEINRDVITAAVEQFDTRYVVSFRTEEERKSRIYFDSRIAGYYKAELNAALDLIQTPAKLKELPSKSQQAIKPLVERLRKYIKSYRDTLAKGPLMLFFHERALQDINYGGSGNYEAIIPGLGGADYYSDEFKRIKEAAGIKTVKGLSYEYQLIDETPIPEHIQKDIQAREDLILAAASFAAAFFDGKPIFRDDLEQGDRLFRTFFSDNKFRDIKADVERIWFDAKENDCGAIVESLGQGTLFGKLTSSSFELGAAAAREELLEGKSETSPEIAKVASRIVLLMKNLAEHYTKTRLDPVSFHMGIGKFTAEQLLLAREDVNPEVERTLWELFNQAYQFGLEGGPYSALTRSDRTAKDISDIAALEDIRKFLEQELKVRDVPLEELSSEVWKIAQRHQLPGLETDKEQRALQLLRAIPLRLPLRFEVGLRRDYVYLEIPEITQGCAVTSFSPMSDESRDDMVRLEYGSLSLMERIRKTSSENLILLETFEDTAGTFFEEFKIRPEAQKKILEQVEKGMKQRIVDASDPKAFVRPSRFVIIIPLFPDQEEKTPEIDRSERILGYYTATWESAAAAISAEKSAYTRLLKPLSDSLEKVLVRSAKLIEGNLGADSEIISLEDSIRHAITEEDLLADLPKEKHDQTMEFFIELIGKIRH